MPVLVSPIRTRRVPVPRSIGWLATLAASITCFGVTAFAAAEQTVLTG
jgi:hypothetical protein